MSESIDTLVKAIENNVGFGTLRSDDLTFKEFNDLFSAKSEIHNLGGASGKIARPVVLDGHSAFAFLAEERAKQDEITKNKEGTIGIVVGGDESYSKSEFEG